ncbi:MAG: hypothetical protein HOW73_36225 [Polyangiaceae bacterium]|nr:hypothetical protein [Polyangiaceae bacterium]
MASANSPQPCLFPPALAPLIRERLPDHPALVRVSDDTLAELLTTVFFAGLTDEEGERFPIRVAFVGTNFEDVILPAGDLPSSGPMLIYRWSALGFTAPRPFALEELVKLAVVSRSERVYTKVGLRRGRLEILGLTREGNNGEGDPYLKVLAPRTGDMSIRCGREHLIDYERGAVVNTGDNVVFKRGAVRRTFEEAATALGLHGRGVDAYVDAVRALVREMTEHSRGGILVIGNENGPSVPEWGSYSTRYDTPIAELLKHLNGGPSGDKPLHPGSWPTHDLRKMLRTAFEVETERCIVDYGACTAMDGATILDRNLRLRAFGVVLPVAHDIVVWETDDAEGTPARPFDLTTRGARHQAAATYAGQLPGSVVFVASKDGPVSCMFRKPGAHDVVLWRFGLATALRTRNKPGTSHARR